MAGRDSKRVGRQTVALATFACHKAETAPRGRIFRSFLAVSEANNSNKNRIGSWRLNTNIKRQPLNLVSFVRTCLLCVRVHVRTLAQQKIIFCGRRSNERTISPRGILVGLPTGTVIDYGTGSLDLHTCTSRNTGSRSTGK